MNGFQEMSLLERVDVYRRFDEARHEDLQTFAQHYEAIKSRLATLEADLDDERTSRRNWRQRAELAETSVGRNKFAVALIDGDGYHFNRSFYMTDGDSGGARAAHALYTDVQNYVKSEIRQLSNNDDGDTNTDIEVMAIVFFNKQVPARALLDADIIHRASQFDEFMWSFTSSRSLFQTVDCGPGKERADAKLRDMYRFYANNAQCKHIFLACCHDNGYASELDKYCHDPIAGPKTILVKHGNTGNQYYNLKLPFARFTTTFEQDPLQAVRRFESTPAFVPNTTRVPSSGGDSASQTSDSAPVTSTWSTVTAARLPIRTNTNTANLDAGATLFQPALSKTAAGDTKGIPVNRSGQRIDRKIQAPPQSDQDRFDMRIADHKLCNTQHLTVAGCYAYNCKYDHDPIDAAIKQVLKYKARSIPCTAGSKCRKSDCFYGHQCPWGNDKCMNAKCAFWRNGLHEIDDLEIVKSVPAVA